MKSMIQEASSIAKAIQKSWEKAGKPLEFSIKILEEEEKNFIGLTKKPAKIAIFFEDKKFQFQQNKRPPKNPIRETSKSEKKPSPKPIIHPKKTEPPIKKALNSSFWSEEMVKAADEWTKGLLLKLNLPNIKFKITKTRQNLKINFSSPLIKDRNKQRLLFSNLSFLLMQSIRHKFKKTFINLKTVLTNE